MKFWNWPFKGALVAGLAGSLVLAGCGGLVNIPASVNLRGVNAIANSTTVTIGASGSPLLAAGGYMSAGSYTVFNSNPATGFVLLDAIGTQIATATVDTTTGDHFTAYGSNTLATPHLLVIKDDLSAPPAGDGRLKFINLSPVSGTVDVYVTAPAADISAAAPTLSSLVFESFQTVTPAAGTYEIRVTPTGSKTLLLDVNLNTALKTNDIRTFLILDNTGGGAPATHLELNDSGT